jgi:Sporulation protein Cse60
MKCKILTSFSLKDLEEKINVYLEDLPNNSLLDCKFIVEPSYESEKYDVQSQYTAMIIVKGELD